VGDDWLIDDVRGLKRKRPDMDNLFRDVNIRTEKKRNSRQPTSSGQMSEPSRVGSVELQSPADRKDHSLAGQIFDSERTSPESTIVLNDELPVDLREMPASAAVMQRKKQTRLSKSGGIVQAVAGPVSTTKNKADCTVQNVTSTTAIKPPAPNPLKMRLKVRIGDQLILVPVLERFASFLLISK